MAELQLHVVVVVVGFYVPPCPQFLLFKKLSHYKFLIFKNIFIFKFIPLENKIGSRKKNFVFQKGNGDDARYRIGVEAAGGVPAGRSGSLGSVVNCRANRSASSRIVRSISRRGIFFFTSDRQQ
jgi:hypothetical protein